ncbi:MAG: zinc ribbon domain-containing protein [Bacteroidales bacterium]|nr:zinc ribbon domain-containing protein [Bacteroidales bacterium]
MPQFCQCCGMPLRADADCGTEADGSTCFDYCKFCYTDGHFVQQCSMEEMIDHCSQFVGEFNKHTGASLTREAYKMVLEGYFPTLKRWRK